MPIKLVGPSTYNEGDQFTMAGSQSFKSDKRNVKTGKYYYEVTHYSGTNSIIVGFWANVGMVQFFTQYSLTNLAIWLNNDFVGSSGKHSFDIPWSISSSKYTVGLGIDIDAGYFYVFYETNYFSFKYSTIPKRTPFNIVVREAVGDAYSDTVSVNFGSRPFKYNHTAFTKWINNVKSITCKANKLRTNIMLLVIACMITR